MSALLPTQFAALEHLVPEWAIEDGHARYVKRVNSSMAQIRAFYDEVFPHAEAAVAYLDGFDYGQPLPPEWIFISLVATVVAVLPLSLGGGLGTRELVFAEGATYFGLDPALAVVISLLFYFCNLVTSVWGVYYTFRDPLEE